MKRLFTFVLTLALCLSALPGLAFAASTAPLWERAGYDSKAACLEICEITEAEYAQLEKEAATFDPEAYFEEEYGDWYTREEFEEYYLSEGETFEEYLTWDWFTDRVIELEDARFEAWKKSHGYLLSGFDPEAYFEEEHPYWDSPEEYMEISGITRSEFETEMQDEYLRDRYDAEREAQRQKAWAENLISTMGGKPGKVNVVVGGSCVVFPSAAPELVKGRTMVPLRAVMEALGAKVEWTDGGVACTLDGVTLSFRVGDTVLNVTKDGKTETVQMKTAPYLKGNFTYVPVRFFAEALGYDVFWDSLCTSAVLIDKEAVIAELDKDFTIYNEILAWQAKANGDGAREGSLSATMNVTTMDSISGNKTVTASANGTLLASSEAVNLSGTMNLSSLVDLMQAQGDYPELAGLPQMLRSLPYSFIASQEGIFLNMPQLTETGEMDAGHWSLLGSGVSLGGTADRSETLGHYIYDSTTAANMFPVLLSGQLADAAEILSDTWGDSNFTRSGSGYAWKMDTDDYGVGSYDSPYSELEVSATFRPDGNVSFRMAMGMRTSLIGGPVAMRITCSGSSGVSGGNLDMQLQLRNMADVGIKANWNCHSTSRVPVTAPPEGAVIE